MRQQAHRVRRSRRGLAASILLVLVLLGLAALGIDLLGVIGAGGDRSGPAPTATATTSPSPSASPSPNPSPTDGPDPSPAPRPAPDASPSPPSSPSPGPSPSPSPAAISGAAGAAPTGPAGFKVRATVVSMGFPLQSGVRHRYGDGWRAPRDGIVHPYNQIRSVNGEGLQLRAHDGLDLGVPTGTLVVSPFDGVVVDPEDLWTPWDPARYGTVVVIRSSEPTSQGYAVILAHLSRRSVAVGQLVQRGQIVGRTGRTGNAAGAVPHLHIEIRAPFRIRYGYGGVIRWLDAFDIEPSLRAADPAAG